MKIIVHSRSLQVLLLGALFLGLGLTGTGCDLLGESGNTSSEKDDDDTPPPSEIYVERESGLLDVGSSTASFGDLNNDGTIDLFLSGDVGDNENDAAMYVGDGSGGFTDITSSFTADLPRRDAASSAFGDVDNDGDLDLVVTGQTNDYNPKTTLYLGDGAGDFINSYASLEYVSEGSSSIGDVNGDGNLDVLITGSSTATLYLGNEDAGFEPANADLENVSSSASSIGDVNNDGNLDLLIAGALEGDSNSPTATLYLGDGTGDFTPTDPGLNPVGLGAATSMGDINNDGNLDLLISGTGEGDKIETTLYLGDGQGGFTAADAGLPDMTVGDTAIGDVNGDGNSDIVLSGIVDGGGPTTSLYLGDGTGGFTAADTGLKGVQFGAVALGDIDGDDDLDLLVSGDSSDDIVETRPTTILYENQTVSD